MKFKRDWKVLYRDLYGTVIIIYFVLCIFFIPFIIDGDWSITFIFLVPIPVVLGLIAASYVAGEFTNIITLDGDGITLQQRKQPPLKIRWDEVEKILRTRYIGGKAIVFWDECGRKIWFYSSKRLDRYILSNHPELAPLFPAKNDVRKWEQWDKKLRF
jgi:hypothetical protein